MNQIRDFVAVVQAGSLRAAARGIGVSQPAITQSIRQLEAELRVQLLQRSARGAVPTHAGKVFLARARIVQAELRKAVEDLGALRDGEEETVAFGMSPQTALLVVPEAMQHFRRRHPHARVRILEGIGTALLPGVRDETLDFAIAVSPAAGGEPGLRSKPLTRLPLVVASRPGHPLSRAGSLRELADARWLVYYPTGSANMLEAAFRAAGLGVPRGLVQCESCATAVALIAQTDTLGLLTPRLIDGPPGPYRLQQIKVREPIPGPLLALYTRRDAPLTAAAATLAQALTASAARAFRSSRSSA